MDRGKGSLILAFLLGVAATALVFESPRFLGLQDRGANSSRSGHDDARSAKGSPQATPSLDEKSEAQFRRFYELATQGGGGSFYGTQLLEQAEALDPARFPEYAREVAALPSDLGLGSRAVDIFFAVWAQHDLPAATRFALSMPRNQFQQRSSAVSGLIDAWPSSDVDGMLEFARHLQRDSDRRTELRHLLWKASAADPEAAMAAADEFGINLSDRSGIVSKWAEKDEAAARGWVRGQPPGRARETLANVEAAVLARHNPEAALAWIELIDSPRAQERAVSMLMQEWSATDRAAAWKFVEAQQTPTIRDAARAGYIIGWANTDPAAAAKFLGDHPDLPQVSMLAYSTLESWVYRDPASAAGWVTSFPGGESKNQAVGMVVKQWCQEAESDSLVWLEHQIPPGPERDNVISDVAGDVGDENPAQAIRIAALLPLSRHRSDIEEANARRWIEKDPLPAATWIHSSDLTEDVKARLLAPPPR